MSVGASVAGVRVPVALVEAAMRLRAEAPQHLEVLRQGAFAAADQAARDLVSTPPESFLSAQGRAQAFLAIATLFAKPEAYLTGDRK